MSELVIDARDYTHKGEHKRIREHIVSTDPFAHLVIKNVLDEETIAAIQLELEKTFNAYYENIPHSLNANLKDHSVYISDRGNNRTSHGLQMGDRFAVLPCIQLHRNTKPMICEHEKMYRTLMWILGEDMSPRHRSFLGWQRYQSNASPICPHQDGEYMEFEPTSDGFIAHQNLAPKYVLLFLLKTSPGCKDTVFTTHRDDTDKRTVNMEVGDAVLWTNWKLWHQVPKQPDLGTSDSIIRETFGFRSWDVSPVYIERNEHGGYGKRHLTSESGLAWQQKWLEEEWPKIYAGLDKAVF